LLILGFGDFEIARVAAEKFEQPNIQLTIDIFSPSLWGTHISISRNPKIQKYAPISFNSGTP